MRMNTQFTVSVQILILISISSGQKISGAMIAESTGCNPVMVRRQFGKVKEAGLLNTTAGKGTTTLAKDTSEITLWYRLCGVILMLMNTALSGVVILVLRKNEGFEYAGYLIYVMAIYALCNIINAVRDVVKYRKYKSPVMSAAKADYDRNYGRVRLYDCAWDCVFYDDTINKAAEKQQYGRLLNW